MLEKDSYVIYGGYGVCRVVDVRSETMYKKTQTYYILTPLDNAGMAIYIPVNNDALISRMRKIPCREEILFLLDGLREERLVLEKDNRLRAEQLDLILDRCDQRELILLVRTLWEKRKALAMQNKKICTADDIALKRAEKIINGEFGFALSIAPEDVPAFIADRLAQAD